MIVDLEWLFIDVWLLIGNCMWKVIDMVIVIVFVKVGYGWVNLLELIIGCYVVDGEFVLFVFVNICNGLLLFVYLWWLKYMGFGKVVSELVWVLWVVVGNF